jgi:hypothetical protein
MDSSKFLQIRCERGCQLHVAASGPVLLSVLLLLFFVWRFLLHCRRAKFCRGEGCGTMLACLQDPVRTARRTKRRGRGPEENGNKPLKDKGGVQQASHSCRQSALRGHDKTMVHGRPPWVSLSAVPRATARRQRTNDRPARLNQSNGR